MNENTLEAKTKQLMDSFDIGKESVNIELKKFIDYLQTYSDQRKKPSEIHGLDKWAHEKLGFKKKEYSDSKRKLLRKYFYQAEKDILDKAKLLLELMFDETRTDVIKTLLRKPLKDELKIHICQIVAEKHLPGFEESIINLYLKGTKKSSQAAFECMLSLKDIKYYYPLKRLKPSRHEINDEDIEAGLREFKQIHFEVALVEDDFQVENYQKFYSHFDISKLCDVLIALNYPEQKSIYQTLRSHFQDHFQQIGKRIESNYSVTKHIKSQDYLSSLKKAMGDSLMIGGWEVNEKTEFLLARNLASQKDLGYVEQVFDSLNIKYRQQYFKSVLNPPKHIKDEFNKKRLFWVYDKIQNKFKSDFENFGNFIRWHIGNDDAEIKIETMLLITSLIDDPGEEIIKSLKKFSQDDCYQKYHDRINIVLPNDSLLLNRRELPGLSYSALESKLSIILKKHSPLLFNDTIETLCNYLKEINGDHFEFVFKQIIYLIKNKINVEDQFAEDHFFEALVDILQQDKNIALSFRKDFLLANHYFLHRFSDHYPHYAESIPEKFIGKIVENCFLIQTDATGSIKIALQLSLEDKQYNNLIWAEWVNKFVSDKNNLTQVIDSLTQNEKKDLFLNILVHISHLKKELLLSEDKLEKENERMQRLIVSEILPKLERAKRRAGDQPLLTENYNMIISILSDYVQKVPVKTFDKKTETIEENAYSSKSSDSVTSVVDVIENVSSIPLAQRNKIIKDYIEKKLTENEFKRLLQEAKDIPPARKEWFLYRLFDYVLDNLIYKDSLIQYSKEEEKNVWSIMNKMLYRLYTEHQEALRQIQLSRDNKLKEIGKAISEFLEKIEINLFGYYELSENLSKMGLRRIFNKPGEIVSKENVDVKQHKVLPSQKGVEHYQVITLGLKLQTGETVREAFLESKED